MDTDRESFKRPEASRTTQEPGKRLTVTPNDTLLERHLKAGDVYKITLQNLPIVAEMMIYDMVVANIASSVPLGIATVGFWKRDERLTERFLMYSV